VEKAERLAARDGGIRMSGGGSRLFVENTHERVDPRVDGINLPQVGFYELERRDLAIPHHLGHEPKGRAVGHLRY
jgi:hypothetical protein